MTSETKKYFTESFYREPRGFIVGWFLVAAEERVKIGKSIISSGDYVVVLNCRKILLNNNIMIFKESEFEKQKRLSQGKYKFWTFYSNPDDDRTIVPNRWGFWRGDINIAHPRFRRMLLFIVILILTLTLIFEHIV